MNKKEFDIFCNIKRRISQEFPNILVDFIVDDIFGDIEFYINDKNIYYSTAYQELVTNIKLDTLWKNNINNVIFIYDENQVNRINFHVEYDFKSEFVYWENNDIHQDNMMYQLCDNNIEENAA